MKARPVEGLEPDGTLADNAERIVRVRLDELCAFMPRASLPEEVVALHDMRIAAKRLRYILEVTGACFGPYASTATRHAKASRTCWGRSTTATSRSPPSGPSASGCARRTPARCVPARRRAEDLDPGLLRPRRTRATTPGWRRWRSTSAPAARCSSAAS